jgi:hypothetical protein
MYWSMKMEVWPIETIQGSGERGIEENDGGGEFN